MKPHPCPPAGSPSLPAPQNTEIRNNILLAVSRNADRRPRVQHDHVDSSTFKSMAEGVVTHGAFESLLQTLNRARTELKDRSPRSPPPTSYLPTPPVTGESDHASANTSWRPDVTIRSRLHGAQSAQRENSAWPTASSPVASPPSKRRRLANWGKHVPPSSPTEKKIDTASEEYVPSLQSPERGRGSRGTWQQPARDSGYRTAQSLSVNLPRSRSRTPEFRGRSRWGRASSPLVPARRPYDSRRDSSHEHQWRRSRTPPSSHRDRSIRSPVSAARRFGRGLRSPSPDKPSLRSYSSSISPSPPRHRVPATGSYVIRSRWDTKWGQLPQNNIRTQLASGPDKVFQTEELYLQSNAMHVAVKPEPQEEKLAASGWQTQDGRTPSAAMAVADESDPEEDMDTEDQDEAILPSSPLRKVTPQKVVQEEIVAEPPPQDGPELSDVPQEEPELSPERELSPEGGIVDLSPRPVLEDQSNTIWCQKNKFLFDRASAGLWLVQPGAAKSCVHETHIQLAEEPVPSLSLRMYCLPAASVRQAFATLEAGTRRKLKNVSEVSRRVVEECRIEWPESGTLIFQVQSFSQGSQSTKCWLPQDIQEVCSCFNFGLVYGFYAHREQKGFLDLKGHLHKGNNVLRFIHLRPTRDRVFVIRAAEANTIKSDDLLFSDEVHALSAEFELQDAS